MLGDGAWKKAAFCCSFQCRSFATALSHYGGNVVNIFPRSKYGNKIRTWSLNDFPFPNLLPPLVCLFWFTNICENFCSTSPANATDSPVLGESDEACVSHSWALMLVNHTTYAAELDVHSFFHSLLLMCAYYRVAKFTLEFPSRTLGCHEANNAYQICFPSRF